VELKGIRNITIKHSSTSSDSYMHLLKQFMSLLSEIYEVASFTFGANIHNMSLVATPFHMG